MTTAVRLKENMKKEINVSSKVPYTNIVSEDTIETKNGNLLQVIRLTGLMAETLDDEWLDIEKRLRNAFLISLTDSSISFYFHTIRKKVNINLQGTYEDGFLQQLHDKWQAKLFRQDFYVNEHYITVVKKPPVGKIRRLTDIVETLSASFNKLERQRYRDVIRKDLDKITKQIITTFSDYGAIKLINEYCDQKKDIISHGLSSIAYLINLEERSIVAPRADISDIIPTKRLFFDDSSGTMAFRGINNRSRYAALISIKNYSHITYAGMLDKLFDIKAEIVLCQSFSPIEKEAIRGKVKEMQRNHTQSDDGQTKSSDQISDVLDEVGSSESTLGVHHFTLLCQADSVPELDNKVSEIDAVLNQIGIIALREDIGIKPAFFGMLPGNHAYITRKAIITSKNMASLASFHNTNVGSVRGNYWGDAVTVLETISGSPYYFNFHVMDVANTFMIGPMGSGKTLLQAFLVAQSMRFGGKLFVFDKDRGLEIFIRAQDGTYSLLKMGKRTGFAPFQLDDSPDNRYFLFRLMRKVAELSGTPIDSEKEEILQVMVNGAFTLPKEERVLRNIVPFLGMKKAGSLRAIFENWINEGSYAWVFDNNKDTLAFGATATGFDMTSVMEDSLVASIIYDYLFNRIESQLDGTRTRIVIAEGWRALIDETFKEKIRDWSSTPRKKNAFLIMDTQSPSDIAQSELACKIIQETVTQIYFANPSAQYDDYVGQFKLTQKEYQIIKSLNKESRFFLLKQGKNSVVVRADLREGFEREIAVLSGREQNVRMLEQIMAAKGEATNDWLEEYFKQLEKRDR